MSVKPIDRTLIRAASEVFFVTNQKDFDAALKKVMKKPKKIPMIDEGMDGCTHVFSNGAMIVAVNTMPRKKIPEAHAIIAHEATHVWQNHRDYICEVSPSAEFEAYAVGNICHQFFKQYERDLRKVEKKAARKVKAKVAK